MLVELARERGARVVLLARRLGVPRDSLTRTLAALVESRLVRRNPGYGHPLRPEYLLTRRGERAAHVCKAVLDAAPDDDVVLRKWSLPVLAALGEGSRFSELRARVPGIGSRALALALKELQRADLVAREVLDEYPPATVYRPTAAGRRLQRAARAHG